jgi:hypothetical protein
MTRLLATLLILVPLAAGAVDAGPSGPGDCLVPKATMNKALRSRISPRALCRDYKLPPAWARPVEVTPQDVPSAAGRVAVEYTAPLQEANAWLARGWPQQAAP